MPMTSAQIESDLREAFPDADIHIDDLAGDGDHYRARIVSRAFAGLSRVRAEVARLPRYGERSESFVCQNESERSPLVVCGTYRRALRLASWERSDF